MPDHFPYFLQTFEEIVIQKIQKHPVCCHCCHAQSSDRGAEFQRDDRAEVYIIIMLSGHKAASEAGRDRDRKKRTTDSCAELCSSTESGCGLSAGLRCVCCLCERRSVCVDVGLKYALISLI